MIQSQIDEILHIFDDVADQMGEPDGYDEAVRRIGSAIEDPRHGNAMAIQIAMVFAQHLLHSQGGGNLKGGSWTGT